jgi:LacI family transcriptional regulator
VSVTLKDVAKLAKVTPTVVSHVLNDKASTVRVSPATAERVRLAAATLGYRVNVMARNFRERQTKTLGVLNGRGLARPTFAKGPRYFATLMDGIVDSAFRHGFSVSLCPQLLGDRPEDGVGDGRFDGLIWYSVDSSEDTMKVLERIALPLVIVHSHAKDFKNLFPTVIADNFQGVGLAIDHLVELGHSRIGFAIEDDALNVESLERLQSYRNHMDRLNLSCLDKDVIKVGRDRQALRNYLEAPCLPHSAILVHADGLAAELVVAAQEFGHRVPDDLAVIGWDSTDFCNEIRPTLTSVSQPLFELGGCATHQLIRLIAGEALSPLELILPCRLEVRGSTVFSKET